jgi:hypothetical protein
MRRKLSRAWTAEDINQLRQLAAAKWSVARIGARLRRSPRVVKMRALLNGIQLGPAGDEAKGRSIRHALPSAGFNCIVEEPLRGSHDGMAS